jgi:hypothetical protein
MYKGFHAPMRNINAALRQQHQGAGMRNLGQTRINNNQMPPTFLLLSTP